MENYANINNNNREDKMYKLKETISITIVALAFMLITGVAKADSYKNIKGTVTSVEAKYGTNNVHTPQEVCSVKEVPIYSQSSEPNIVGAIIGGYLGSKIGGGKGNDIAIGTGAVIGSQMGNKKIVGYKQVRTCETQYITTQASVLEYYIISWEADGFSGKARSNRAYNTGDSITVQLLAQPQL